MVTLSGNSKLSSTGSINVGNGGSLHNDGGTVSAVALNVDGGSVTGGGLFDANFALSNGASFGPGNSPGIANIDGDYMHDGSSTLVMEIGGPDPGVEYDVMIVSGTANLAATLQVVAFHNGSPYSPSAGDIFDIIEANQIVGEFDTIILFELPHNRFWTAQILFSAGLGGSDILRLQVAAVPLGPAAWMVLAPLMVLTKVSRRRRN